MLVLLVNRGGSSDRWFWVPLVGSLRKVPITHYKPNLTGGADDILQLEHTGIYKIQYAINYTYTGDELHELKNALDQVFQLQGKDSLNLDDDVNILQRAYNAFDKLTPLFTACSAGRITSASSGDTILEYDITGWADAADQTEVLTFAKLNVYNYNSNSPQTHIGLLSIPNDTKQVKVITITRTAQSNGYIYSYVELINLAINNVVTISDSEGSVTYMPNTLNLHLYIGEISSIRVTQQSTYMIDNKTKNVTPHIYPPTAHGYGTTLMPMKGNTVIDSIARFVSTYRNLSYAQANMLFYDVVI
jgi:hypothetical protein